MADIVTLLAHSGATHIHWLGTCLGGILGMMLAAQPRNPLKSLILNDVGMSIPHTALERSGSYARNAHHFSTFEEALAYFQAVLSPMGPLDLKKWEHITKYGTLTSPKGELRLAYDPAVGEAFKTNTSASLHLETYWKAIDCPLFILRGEDSDFLPPEVAEKMRYDHPTTQITAVPECGHAPSLMDKSHLQLIGEWLETLPQEASPPLAQAG